MSYVIAILDAIKVRNLSLLLMEIIKINEFKFL